jgi:DNA-binding NarL/FixJ family response regulator
MGRPQVLLAEDNPAMAAELRTLLEVEFDVAATVEDGAALLARADAMPPDVVVTDIVMPGRSGIDATRELLRRHPGIPVVLVTIHDDAQLVERGRAAGALGHVLKAAAVDDLVPAVHAALRHERYVSERLRGRCAPRPDSP